ncbi:MAG: flagellar hook-length control protein FliK [bacterium]|nr:flagellar hook-length control protein FliK [bacterium]
MKASNVELGSISKLLAENTASNKGKEASKSSSGTSFSSVMNKTGQSLTSSYSYSGSSAKGFLSNDISSSFKTTSSSVNSSNAKSTASRQQGKSLKEVIDSLNNGGKADEGSVLATYTSELTSKLKEELGLTDQEIEDLLAKMGICASQLFDPAVLQQFVLESYGADSVSDALINEQLADSLMKSSSILEEILSSLETEIIKLPEVDEANSTFEELISDSETTKDSAKASTDSKQSDIQVEIHKDNKTENGSTFSDGKREGRGDGEFQSTNFVDYFANKVDLNSLNTADMAVPEFKQIVTNLVEQIKLTINPANTSVELVLNPESLGKVQIVVAEKDGVLTARMNVENQIAKEALESSLQQLKQSFEEQGLKVQKVEVAIGNYSNEYAEHEGNQDEQANQGAKKKLRVEDYMEEAFVETEGEQPNVVNSLTGTVEYTA